MSARDELAHELFIADNYNAPDPEHEWQMTTLHHPKDAEYAFDIADAILAAGYRKPRTITTAEELDGLAVGAVLIDRDRDICQRFRTGWRATIHECPDDPWLTDTLEVDLPATVLYEPTA